MKIRAPDEVEMYEENKAKSHTSEAEDNKTFQEEIKQILKLPSIPPKFVVDGSACETPQFKLQVLVKFTELCREEIFPRHIKVVAAIQSKSDELKCKLISQKKELVHLDECRCELKESMDRLGALRTMAQSRHRVLNERLNETLIKLQNFCKNRTVSEKKMAQDLITLKKKSEDIQVAITDTSAKMNYYITQVDVQTNVLKKNPKPLYLDKNRVVFIKTNLYNMTQNIEELVHRVKRYNELVSVSKPAEIMYCSDSSKIENYFRKPFV